MDAIHLDLSLITERLTLHKRPYTKGSDPKSKVAVANQDCKYESDQCYAKQNCAALYYKILQSSPGLCISKI